MFSSDDVLIILGDAGINYYGDDRDSAFTDSLWFPFKLLCIHGNHEMRPSSHLGYHEKLWHDGNVYMDERHPGILFAKDGEVYDLDGRSALAIGGAYSVDKPWRLASGAEWFSDEQPSEKNQTESGAGTGGTKLAGRHRPLPHLSPGLSAPGSLHR